MRENNNRRPVSRNNNHSSAPRSNNRDNSHNILPPSRVLESYEDIAPGSVNKLLELAKKEQEHRHSWQDRYLKFHSFSYKTGLVFSFLYSIAFLAMIFALIKSGEKSLALKLFVVYAALVVFAIVVTTVERKITTRKPPRRTYQGKERSPSASSPRPTSKSS